MLERVATTTTVQPAVTFVEWRRRRWRQRNKRNCWRLFDRRRDRSRGVCGLVAVGPARTNGEGRAGHVNGRTNRTADLSSRQPYRKVGHFLTSVEKLLVNSSRHFTLADTRAVRNSRDRFSRANFCGPPWLSRNRRIPSSSPPGVRDCLECAGKASRVRGDRSRAPCRSVPRRERRGEEDGASGPRERYRCCELAPCAQPVRHTRVFDESCVRSTKLNTTAN